MQISITLTDKEVIFLERVSKEISSYMNKQISIEDAVHECIKMAIHEEAEERI